MRRIVLFLAICCTIPARAQQYALYNTKTLVDAFENPARKVYTQDTSRKYSFNFFIPNMGINMINAGSAQYTIKTLITRGAFNGSQLPLGKNEKTSLLLNNNTYLAMFRIYRNVLAHSEMGFSWQVRSDSYARVTNESISILYNYKLFPSGTYKNPFNDNGYSVNYHQFGFSYRENVDKWTGFGFKVSYLSGIAYNKLTIRSSSLTIIPEANTFNFQIDGKLRSSLDYDSVKVMSATDVVKPGFKNPGLAISAGITHRTLSGWNISAHVKDIGAIRWHHGSKQYTLNDTYTITNTSGSGAVNNLGDELYHDIKTDAKTKSFVDVINGKAEVTISRNYEHYRPTLLLSKNTFYRGGDAGLINNFMLGNFQLGVSTVYNTVNAFQVGGVGMFKSPSFELFLGTDQLLKTARLVNAVIDENNYFGKGYTGASFYFGISFNFGRLVEHPMNSNTIPGIER